MAKSTEHTLLEAFTANLDIIGEGLPARLNAERGGYMEAFMLAGLPDAHDERFLQYDMRELFRKEEREIYFTAPRTTEQFDTLTGVDEVTVTNNGFPLTGSFQGRIDGVVCGPMKSVFKAYPQIITLYNSIVDNASDALAALNSAFTQDGVVVYVPVGVTAGKIMIDNHFGSDDEAQLCFGRTLVILDEGATADLTILYRTAGETNFLIDHVREIVVDKGATLRLSESVVLGEGSTLLLNSYTRQESDSHTEGVFVATGEGDVRLSQRNDLAGEHSETHFAGLYVVAESQKADIELRLNHLAPDCRSRQLVKGIAADKATGVFTGMVYVDREAQRTDAVQQNRNIQLHDTARIYTRPQLEIYADDVKCGHGATVGRLNEEEIYYMRQRGISEDVARQMQMEGFAADITERSHSVTFREYVSKCVIKQISGDDDEY
jgi:Fe-S cluster assembly protein SufD